MNKTLLLQHIENEKALMPWFVLEYIHSMNVINRSPATLYEYLKEYHRFFDWLIDSNIVDKANFKDIPIEVLEHLKKSEIESYIIYLRERPKMTSKTTQYGVSQKTINRTISALSSLFNYLTRETENEEGEPYFYRNVMDKIKTIKETQTLRQQAANIKEKLFLGEETQEFLDYIDQIYETTLSQRALASFKKNKERDLAIIALMLASGLRLSECTNADLQNLNLNTLVIEVIRKGGKKDAVNIAPFAKPYLEQYLNIRKARYNALKDDKALFLSTYKGVANRIDNRTVENLVSKYSASFKIKITPHKLRHTLATRLYAETKSQALVGTQLGHKNTATTDIYTHIINDENQKALDKL
ncbi:tyrosine recombinase XerS [Lactococcus kimchii]|uniref:tyrosine recombinase XerS n=1 Tax=Lactococcus sp. S-13 TaxID=2507158 RepID=UPI0010230F73|nr:tyrosine recombinase XerS [Lactococcus sp. S-13]RZI48207.1 tyrosine recombinase XerS [Lactococcus sp. S-13]